MVGSRGISPQGANEIEIQTAFEAAIAAGGGSSSGPDIPDLIITTDGSYTVPVGFLAIVNVTENAAFTINGFTFLLANATFSNTSSRLSTPEGTVLNGGRKVIELYAII